MNNFAIDKKLMRQLAMIKSEKKPSEKTLHSLYAQAMIEYSIYRYKKEQMLNEIDKTLMEKDEDRFIILTEKYKQLLAEYKIGKTLQEQGLEIHLTFDI